MQRADCLNDPIWEYTLGVKLTPYLEPVRKFWQNIDQIDIRTTGVYDMPGCTPDTPGLMYRVTSTPVRSPIKNVQVFPFVPTSYLQFSRIAGGSNKMVARVCMNNKFTIEEFTIVEKSNLPSTYHQGQFVAFIPTDILNSTELAGKYIYLKREEMCALMQNTVPMSVKQKVIKYL